MSTTFTAVPIATGTSGDALVTAINQRLQQLATAINGAASGQPQISGNLNMGAFQINNLGDPAAPTDALNMRSADKRYAAIGSISQVSSSSSGNRVITSGGGVTVLAQTLTGPVTIDSPVPVSQGNLLVALLLQDGTGGRVVTWSNPPFRVSQTNLGQAENTYSILIFTAVTDPADGILKWFLTAIPITNAS